MRLHDDWEGVDWGRDPAAPAVGPFPRRGFVEAWWRHRESSLPAAGDESALASISQAGEGKADQRDGEHAE